MEAGEDFFVRYFNGSVWTTVATYTVGSNFNNNAFYKATVNITGVTFPSNAQFRIQCDASDNTDLVYIDQVTVVGSNVAAPTNGGGISQNCELIGLTANNLDANENKHYLLVYPNPVVNTLTLQTAERVSTIKIYSMDGKMVKQFGPTQNGTNLDVSQLKAGMYLATFITGDGVISRKFIKQ